MSKPNSSTLERLFRLWTMVSKMVMEGKRSVETVCIALQKIVDATPDLSAPSKGKLVPLDIRLCWRIECLPLPQNIISSLRQYGIRFIGQIVNREERWLLLGTGLSTDGVKYVEEALDSFGLKVGMELTPDQRRTIHHFPEGYHLSDFIPIESIKILTIDEGGKTVLWGMALNHDGGKTVFLRFFCPSCGKETWKVQGSRETDCVECLYGSRKTLGVPNRTPAVLKSDARYHGGFVE